jgi:hypothetical protein
MSARLLLSYDITDIDPGMAFHDEGLPRLKLLRIVLRVADNCLTNKLGFDKKGGASGPLLNSASALGIANLLWPSQAPAERQKNINSIMTNTSDNAQIALLRRTLCSYSPGKADEVPEVTRVTCIAVRKTDEVVDPSRAAEKSNRYIELRGNNWRCRLVRTAPSKIELVCERRRAILSLDGCKDGSILIDRLFTPGTAPLVPPRPLTLRPPANDNELPDCLSEYLADVLQRQFRIHALFDAARPAGSRPLCIERATVNEEYQDHKGNVSCCVFAYFHASCGTCICPAWHRCKASGRSYVRCEVQVCGRNSTQRCPHTNNTRKNAFVPGMCTSDLKMAVQCVHGKEEHKGIRVSIGTDRITQHAKAELLTILYGARAFQHERKKIEMTKLLGFIENDLMIQQCKINREYEKETKPHEVMCVRDALCVDLLRRGFVSQSQHKKGVKPHIIERAPGASLKDMSKEESNLKEYHLHLFPPYAAMKSPIVQPPRLKPATSSASLISIPSSVASSQGPPKRQRTAHTDLQTMDLVEYVDVEWAMAALEQSQAGMVNPELDEGQRLCAHFFASYTTAILEKCGPEQISTEGRRVRPLHVTYKRKHGAGRFFADETSGLYDGRKQETRGLNCQAAPSLLREFYYRGDHDFDQANAQMEIFKQMCKKLTWSDGTTAQETHGLNDWCDNRADFIDDVAEFHGLPPDSERWADARKDDIKKLILSLTFGGSYVSWIRDVLYSKVKGEQYDYRKPEPQHPRVLRFQQDMQNVRECVFRSNEWKCFVAKDTARLQKEGQKTAEQIPRSVFSRIAQTEEHKVLMSMLRFLNGEGFQVRSLCFDGLQVAHCAKTPDLRAMQERIKIETGYDIAVVEKPLYREISQQPPTLCFKRYKTPTK